MEVDVAAVPVRSPTRKSHVCPECKKNFFSSKGLQQHHIIHTDQKPFICNICQKAFRFKSNLFEHKSLHTGAQPYICQLCGKSCRLKGNLKKHLKTHLKAGEVFDIEQATREMLIQREQAIAAQQGKTFDGEFEEEKTVHPKSGTLKQSRPKRSKLKSSAKTKLNSGGAAVNSSATDLQLNGLFQNANFADLVPSPLYQQHQFNGDGTLPSGNNVLLNTGSGPVKVLVCDSGNEEGMGELGDLCVASSLGPTNLQQHGLPRNGHAPSKAGLGTPPRTCSAAASFANNGRLSFAKLFRHVPFETSYACVHCGEFEAPRRQELLTHIFKRHADLSELLCKICLKGYATQPELERHLNVHKRVKELVSFGHLKPKEMVL